MNHSLQKCDNIYQAFLDHVHMSPDKVALIFDNTHITYQQLNDRVTKLSNHLEKHEIISGSLVSVVLPNCIEYVVLLLVAAKSKLVLVPFNHNLPLSGILDTCKKLNIKNHVVWHGLFNEFQNSIDAECCSFAISAGQNNWQDESYQPIGNEQIKQSGSFFDKEIYKNNTPYIVCMSSGSTGNPKPILLSQQTKLRRIAALEKIYRLSASDLTLASTPLYHSLAMRLVLQPLVMGGTSVLCKSFQVDQWLEAIKKHNVSFTIAVSSQLRQVAKRLQSGKQISTNLRCLVSSSEQLPEEIKSILMDHLNCEFHECYGTSEVGIVTNIKFDNEIKLKTVGKTISNVSLKILDDSMNELPVNQTGEIACKTDMAFTEYLDMSDETNQSMHNGYFLTGDLGYLDDQGYLYYKGRKKDLIICGGINIYPKDIEDVIRNIPGIKEVAVVPKLDPNLGEVVKAVIVTSNTDVQPLKSIKRFCAENLADFQFPREIVFTESLPKNSLGKIQKHRIIETITG